MDINLDELTLDNIGSWPKPIKGVVCAMICAVVLFLTYWFDTKKQIAELDKHQKEELALRDTFEEKQSKAVNLDAYKKQMKVMEASYGALLRQLPESTEVPGLVEDISHQGLASGLTFKSIKLRPEKKIDFYAELAIDILLEGTYHELGDFVSSIASLPRIVTLHDFVIKGGKQENGLEHLSMSITAKTYRYIGEDSE